MKKSKIALKESSADKIFYLCLIFLPLLQFAFFYIGVNIRSILYAFQGYDGMGGYYFNNFENFSTVFKTIFKGELAFGIIDLQKALLNSIYVFLFGVFVGTPLSVFFSLYIYKKMSGFRFFRVILFLPTIFPAVVMSFVFTGITDSVIVYFARLIDPLTEFKGIIVDSKYAFTGLLIFSIWVGFGSGVLLYVGAMTAIPESVVEASELDGCNSLQEFFYITLPYIWPTFSTFIVVNFGAMLNNQFSLYTFYESRALTSDYATVGYIIFAQTQRSVSLYPQLATYGLFFTIIIAPLTLLLRRALNKIGYSTL